MKVSQRKGKEGFTLIELMIVVAIVGILAVLAVYGVRKYLANAKTAEARNSLGQIAKDSAAEYERESMQSTVLGQGSSAANSRALCATEPKQPIPATGNIAGKKYQSSAADWNAGAAANAGFACLKFTIDAPQYYAYSYTESGTAGAPGETFVGMANGDLNGDGVLSTFSITGTVNSSYILNVAPNLLEQNPEE